MQHQNRFFIIFLMSFLVIFTGCHLQPIQLNEIGNLNIQSVSGYSATLKISATVHNPNSTINIKNSEIYVYLKNNEIGKITQLGKITLKGKSSGKYSALLKIELTNLKGGMLSALSMFNGNKKDITLNGKAVVTTFFYRKTITFKDYPVKF